MKRRTWLRIATGLLGLALLGALVVVSGVIPIAASSGHWPITAWFLHFAMERSVSTHALGATVPEPAELRDRRWVLMGAGHYEHGCRFCHGAPGFSQPRVPLSATPHPPPLSDAARTYDPAELHYIVRHGIKFTGMPAWPTQARPDEVWALVAFLQVYPELDAEGYRDLVFGPTPARADAAPEVVIDRCARCHGVGGLGRGLGAFPRLAGQRLDYLVDALSAYTRGERHSGIMQPLAADLTDAQVLEVSRWYAAQPPHAVPGPPPTAGLGRTIARDGIPARRIPACEACHGPREGPEHEAYPILAGQYPEYLEQQLRLFYEGRRGGGPYADVMQTVAAHQLRPDEMTAVAEYYAAIAR